MPPRPLFQGREVKELRAPGVAIVGFSPSNVEAPWADPVWEKWLCNRGGLQPWAMAWDRHFDPHPIEWTKTHFTHELFAEYKSWLEQERPGQTVYHASKIGSAEPFPVAEALAIAGRKYLTSAIGYQIACAIHLGAKRIGLWGIDLKSDTEYGYERPNVEWLLGIAQGRGIEIVLPDVCALLNNDGNVPLYGIDEENTHLADVERMLSHRLGDINEYIPTMNTKNDAILRDMYIAEGARIQTEIYLANIRQARRGGVIPDVPKIKGT